MVTKYTTEEQSALNEKEKNPNVKVKCPRCGKLLLYREAGNSYEIKCPTEGCLKRVCRGI